MSSLSGDAVATRSPDSADAFARLHQQQLLIIRKTSLPGVVLGGIGILLVLWAALYWTDSAAVRRAYLSIVACGSVMVGLWALALWYCKRDDLVRGFLSQIAATLISVGLLILFIDHSLPMAMVTAFTGLSAGASLLDARMLRLSSIAMTGVVLVCGTVDELNLVQPIAIPPTLLYSATFVAIVSGFRTPITALSMFNDHLKVSRSEALRHARAAEKARQRADAQAQQLRELSGELRDFTYVVSHDLRAPMINIEGFTSALGETLEDFDGKIRALPDTAPASEVKEAWTDAQAEAVESMHFIKRGTDKLNALVLGLLELSRIDSKPQADKEVPLAPLVEQILDSLQHQIRARDIAVHVDPLPTVIADPLRIGQVFGNLIDNAIKYMPEREPRTIAVGAEGASDEPTFFVTDSGSGIPPEQRSKVFRPFRRLDPQGGVAGDGLGLAAVKKIVERHGGRIWIEDAPGGEGASFRFTWPRRPATSERAESERSAA